MKPHPRIRKTIKWGGAAVTVLLVAAWIGSAWLSIYWGGNTGAVGVNSGAIVFLNAHPPQDPGLSVYWKEPWQSVDWKWSVFTSRGNHGERTTSVPLWMLMCVPLTLSGLMWLWEGRSRRRAKLNPCPKCGYDRTGLLKDAKCPECGSVPA